MWKKIRLNPTQASLSLTTYSRDLFFQKSCTLISHKQNLYAKRKKKYSLNLILLTHPLERESCIQPNGWYRHSRKHLIEQCNRKRPSLSNQPSCLPFCSMSDCGRCFPYASSLSALFHQGPGIKMATLSVIWWGSPTSVWKVTRDEKLFLYGSCCFEAWEAHLFPAC